MRKLAREQRKQQQKQLHCMRNQWISKNATHFMCAMYFTIPVNLELQECKHKTPTELATAKNQKHLHTHTCNKYLRIPTQKKPSTKVTSTNKKPLAIIAFRTYDFIGRQNAKLHPFDQANGRLRVIGRHSGSAIISPALFGRSTDRY